jgi:hypothetical protein
MFRFLVQLRHVAASDVRGQRSRRREVVQPTERLLQLFDCGDESLLALGAHEEVVEELGRIAQLLDLDPQAVTGLFVHLRQHAAERRDRAPELVEPLARKATDRARCSFAGAPRTNGRPGAEIDQEQAEPGRLHRSDDQVICLFPAARGCLPLLVSNFALEVNV